MATRYSIPPPIEQQQKSSRESGSSMPKALLCLAASGALFWLACRHNIPALHPLSGLADRFHQVRIPLMELAGAMACGIGFIVWQLRPSEEATPGSPAQKGLSRNTRFVLVCGSILLIAVCAFGRDMAAFVWPPSAVILRLAQGAAIILLLVTIAFGGVFGQKTRIGAPGNSQAGRKPLTVSNAVLFAAVLVFTTALSIGAVLAAKWFFPAHRTAIVEAGVLTATLLILFAGHILARNPSTEPGPSTLQDAEGHDTRQGFRRRLVQAAGICVWILAIVGLLHFRVVREWRGVLCLGQLGVIFVYVRGLNHIRHRILFLARNAKYDSALRLNHFVSMLPLSGESLAGLILFEQGRYREAQAYLQPLAFDARGNPRLASMELYCYALALENDGHGADALPLLDAAVRALPERDALKVALAGCLLDQEKDPDRACKLLEQVMASPSQARIFPADRAHRIARCAWALAACGRRSEAQQQIDAALAAGQGLSPGDLAGVYYFVGEAWRALGETRRAREAYGKAVELRPDGVIAISVQKSLAKLDASDK